MIGDTLESHLYLCFFPWVLSCRSFHWGPWGRRESRPWASPEFAPGYTDLLSTVPACNNPHLHRQSALQAPRGVPAVPGGSRSGAAVLSWPQGRGGYLQLRVPTASPEEPAAAGLRPINYSPSSCLPTQRVQKVLGVLQDTYESRGRGARGSMGASAREKCSKTEWNYRVRELRGRRESRQTDETVYFRYSLFCFRSEPIQGADTTDRRILLLWADGLKAFWEIDSFRIFFHQRLLPPCLTQAELTVAYQTQTEEEDWTFTSLWLVHFYSLAS